MERLFALSASFEDEGFNGGFVMGTPTDRWVRMLGNIRPTVNPAQTLPARQSRNLSYRLQLMEFDCALLLLDREAWADNHPRTLYEPVCALKIQQYCVLAHSILEGIGSHIWRVNRSARHPAVNTLENVNPKQWKAALTAEFLRSAQQPHLSTRQSLQVELDAITGWRDLVHMDRFDTHAELQILALDYARVFDPAYRTFHKFLSALAGNAWPATTSLNAPP